jgi:hypothetical protein
MKLGTLIASLVFLGTACAAVPDETGEGAQVSAEARGDQPEQGELCLQHPGEPTAMPRARCHVDTDCRALSNYCDGCHCLPSGAHDPEPVCYSTMVACFVDPCHFQHSACVAGACTLVDN